MKTHKSGSSTISNILQRWASLLILLAVINSHDTVELVRKILSLLCSYIYPKRDDKLLIEQLDNMYNFLSTLYCKFVCVLIAYKHKGRTEEKVRRKSYKKN